MEREKGKMMWNKSISYNLNGKRIKKELSEEQIEVIANLLRPENGRVNTNQYIIVTINEEFSDLHLDDATLNKFVYNNKAKLEIEYGLPKSRPAAISKQRQRPTVAPGSHSKEWANRDLVDHIERKAAKEEAKKKTKKKKDNDNR
jgi:hypothetical protein